MKVFITKYALTIGILEIEAELSSLANNAVWYRDEINRIAFFHKPEWHESKQNAIKQAEKMRDKKIESLKKQINKLEQLKFD